MLTETQIAFLDARRTAVLATVGGDGAPHAVPCCFALLDGKIYTPLDAKPKSVPPNRLQRVRDIAANPAVCLTADVYDEDWTRLAWLQLRGEAALLMAGEEQRRAVAALRARYAQYASLLPDDAPLIRITLRRVIEWAWSRAAG
jgi:PPOX class probable F420-dependent enzyme